MPFTAAAAAFRTVWAKIRGFRILATPREEAQRYDQCKVCEELVAGQCNLCGCYAAAKAMLALEQCPKHKWLRIWDKKSVR